jgi:hypothetical protein
LVSAIDKELEMKLTIFAAMFAFLLWESPAFAGAASDVDADGIPDTSDNCATLANSQQVDTDGDLCGNRCDTDYDNNGNTTLADFGQFGQAFGKSTDLEKDHTEPNTGPVGLADFGIFGQRFGKAAGPSGTSPGTAACPAF